MNIDRSTDILNEKSCIEYISDPCRNFNVLGTALLVDPKDGRLKYVLSDLDIIFIDVYSGEPEIIEKPEKNWAWAVYNYNNEKLIIGTVSHPMTYIYSLDLKTRKWADVLSVRNEQYIWNFTMASDGMLYGGTYPGCSLLRYDPKENTVVHLGRMSGDPENLYCRFVSGAVRGYVLAECGSNDWHITAWDIQKEETVCFADHGSFIREISNDYICLEDKNELFFYSAEDLKPIDKMIPEKLLSPVNVLWERGKQLNGLYSEPLISSWLISNNIKPQGKTRLFFVKELPDGRKIGIRGQDYFIYNENDPHPKLIKIPATPPVTEIMTIVSDKDSNIWGSCNFGQTIFKYDPATGENWNSPIVSDYPGEVYGMCFVGDLLFLTAYANGDHIVYDHAAAWDQYNNVNPKTIASVCPDLIRPYAGSVAGPDGAVWTGWMAGYGTYGGGITRIDPVTYELSAWYDRDLIPRQCVASICSDDRYIYFTTCGAANGLLKKKEIFYLCALTPEGKMIHSIQFDLGIEPGKVKILKDHIIVETGKAIYFFNTDDLEAEGMIDIGLKIDFMLPLDENLAVFADDKLILTDIVNKRILSTFTLFENTVSSACRTSNGEVYFSSGKHLYRICGLT
jgi:hypothetical protein